MSEPLRLMRILWVAFVGSQILFPIAAFLAERPATPPEPMIAPVLVVVALGVAAASFVVPARMLSGTLRRLELELTESVAAEPQRHGGFYRAPTERQRVFAHPKRAFVRAVPAYQSAFIVSVALSEAIAIWGIPLAFIGFGPAWFVPFFVVGAVLVLVRYPTAARLQRALEQSYGARLEVDTR